MYYQKNLVFSKATTQNHLVQTALLGLFMYLLCLSIIDFTKNKSYISGSSYHETVETYEEEDESYLDDELENNFNSQLILKKNEKLTAILSKNNIHAEDISNIEAIFNSKNFDNTIPKGSRIILETTPKQKETSKFSIVNIKIYKPENLSLLKIFKKDNEFLLEEILTPLTKSLNKIKIQINSSIFSALKDFGIPLSTVNEIINAYSHQIDFQRQIKTGDTMELIIEKYVSPDADFSHYGNIVHSKLNLNGQIYGLYRYNHNSGPSEYFSSEGKSFKKNLLKTPINAARISGYFGKRMHPTLKYTRMHKGIDFAARKGTPIYAAGDGVITQMGIKNGYGNYVVIKHSSYMSTLYAHVSKFHKDLKVGSRVKQGRTIAYVGSTGTATGDHLHFETHINGHPVNPLSIKTVSDTVLNGEKLQKFMAYKNQIQEIDKFLADNPSYQLSSNQ
jgi:murein DD-endopeptidase MepM/ murein hydrolase activator NlpD